MKDLSQKKSSTSLKATERPKVSFGPNVEKCRPVPGKQKEVPRHVAKGHFTPNPGKCWMSSLNKIPCQKFYTSTNTKFPQIPNFTFLVCCFVFSTFFQIKVAVIVLHSLISGLPVHIVLVWICLTPLTPFYILQGWPTPASTRQNGAPAWCSKQKRKKGLEVNSVFSLICAMNHESFLHPTSTNHIWGCFRSHINWQYLWIHLEG